jgi:gamma-glutamylcyclotransferase (GGCT)/AIG2-like uncharacterized protein YtfP
VGFPLFVYGTLRRGEPAEHLMSGAKFLGEAHIQGQVVRHGQYTGLIAGSTEVPGELFDVPEALFEQLDRYEGPGYARRLSEVNYSGGVVTAWVYWLG